MWVESYYNGVRQTQLFVCILIVLICVRIQRAQCSLFFALNEKIVVSPSLQIIMMCEVVNDECISQYKIKNSNSRDYKDHTKYIVCNWFN